MLESSASDGQVVNIGSGSEISIGDTFNLIKKIMKIEAEVILGEERLRPEKSEVHRLCCDNSLLKKVTHYQPQVGFEAGLTKTIEWFSETANLKKYKAHLYNV